MTTRKLLILAQKAAWFYSDEADGAAENRPELCADKNRVVRL